MLWHLARRCQSVQNGSLLDLTPHLITLDRPARHRATLLGSSMTLYLTCCCCCTARTASPWSCAVPATRWWEAPAFSTTRSSRLSPRSLGLPTTFFSVPTRL